MKEEEELTEFRPSGMGWGGVYWVLGGLSLWLAGIIRSGILSLDEVV